MKFVVAAAAALLLACPSAEATRLRQISGSYATRPITIGDIHLNRSYARSKAHAHSLAAATTQSMMQQAAMYDI